MAQPVRISARQKKRLAPFAESFVVMVDAVRCLDDVGLKALRVACEACAETNSGWHEYGAARALLPEIRREQTFRQRKPAR